MFRRSFAFILLGLAAGSTAYGQTPEPRTDNDRAPRPMTWTFDSNGSYLGIETADVTRESAGRLGLREARGVAVEKVVDGSPAQTAGLQAGDVILKFNGEDVTSVRKLTRMVGEVAPDHSVRISVLRGGTERDINVTLGKRPSPKFEGGAFAGTFGRLQMPPMAPMPEIGPMIEAPGFPVLPPMAEGQGDFTFFRGGSSRQIGIGITPLTKQLAEHYGVESGAIVNNVRENSAAAKAGIKAGDIIVEVDGKQVKGDFDLIRAIAEKRNGSISLTFVRAGGRQTVSVTPEEVKGGSNLFFEFPEAPNAPGTPPAPGQFKFTMPAEPPTPLPLNHLFVPGRVI
jgi:membrane-associated protease RseP (regulator of RpoE activity)